MAARKPTALQILKQKKRIEDLQSKLYEEKRKLDRMVRDSGGINTKLNLDGIVYHVRTETRSFDCNVHVERLGTIEEFLKLGGASGHGTIHAV